MANFNSDRLTAQSGSAGASAALGYPLARDAGGKLRYQVIPYTVDGAEASADTITLCRLKKGAVVIPSLCRVLSQAAFDVSDMNVGISGNDNKYADAMDTTDAILDQPFVGGDNRYVPAAITDDYEDIIATLVTVVTTTAGQLVLFLIAYVDE